jgi:hypothetical protein
MLCGFSPYKTKLPDPQRGNSATFTLEQRGLDMSMSNTHKKVQDISRNIPPSRPMTLPMPHPGLAARWRLWCTGDGLGCGPGAAGSGAAGVKVP